MFNVLQTKFTLESAPKLGIIQAFGETINKYGYLDQSSHGIDLIVGDLTRIDSICSLKYS